MYTLDIKDPDKLFMVSDTHFAHFNICRYCHRPFFSRKEMDEALIENWNKVVPEDGIVVHCGDFMLPHKWGLKEYWKYVNRLHGKIYLIPGNHDRIEKGYYNETHPHITGNMLQLNRPSKLIVVDDIMKINVEGISIMASHYPMLAYPTDYQIFGHIHTLSDGTCYGIDGDVTKKLRKTQYDVGVDQNGYKPISYWELVDIFKKKACEEPKQEEMEHVQPTQQIGENFENTLVDCVCKSPDHIYLIKFDNDADITERECYIEPHLSTGNFWERLVQGIKYIFGFKCRYGDFDEIVIDKNTYKPFKQIVKFFEDDGKQS